MNKEEAYGNSIIHNIRGSSGSEENSLIVSTSTPASVASTSVPSYTNLTCRQGVGVDPSSLIPSSLIPSEVGSLIPSNVIQWENNNLRPPSPDTTTSYQQLNDQLRPSVLSHSQSSFNRNNLLLPSHFDTLIHSNDSDHFRPQSNPDFRSGTKSGPSLQLIPQSYSPTEKYLQSFGKLVDPRFFESKSFDTRGSDTRSSDIRGSEKFLPPINHSFSFPSLKQDPVSEKRKDEGHQKFDTNPFMTPSDGLYHDYTLFPVYQENGRGSGRGSDGDSTETVMSEGNQEMSFHHLENDSMIGNLERRSRGDSFLEQGQNLTSNFNPGINGSDRGYRSQWMPSENLTHNLRVLMKAKVQAKQWDDFPKLFHGVKEVSTDLMGTVEYREVEARAAFKEGKFELVQTILSKNSFPPESWDRLQRLFWDSVYAQHAKMKGRPLGAVDKYRLRKKHKLPNSIWDQEETVYCFREKDRKALQDSFLKNPYPNPDDKKLLSDKTGLTPTQVANWFKNRRQRNKDGDGRSSVNESPSGRKSRSSTPRAVEDSHHFMQCTFSSVEQQLATHRMWETPIKFESFATGSNRSHFNESYGDHRL